MGEGVGEICQIMIGSWGIPLTVNQGRGWTSSPPPPIGYSCAVIYIQFFLPKSGCGSIVWLSKNIVEKANNFFSDDAVYTHAFGISDQINKKEAGSNITLRQLRYTKCQRNRQVLQLLPEIDTSFNYKNEGFNSKFLHCKKKVGDFPSPAGMSLTKISLAWNN